VKAFDDGVLLRTHVLRPTWHFALPDDVRWMLRLTAPRLRGLMAYYSRQQGLDAAELARSRVVLAKAVDGGRHRTRKELLSALESAGIPAGGMRLGFILMHAEYDEVLISGAMRGKQQTYAAFDELVPAGPDYDEDEALAELARRYVASRAPVTAKDLSGWASLTLAQARRGLAAIESETVVGELDGMTVWSMPAGSNAEMTDENGSPVVDLIQGYDEIVMSYSESRRLLSGGMALLPVPDYTSYLHAILVDGALAGHWRHQLGRDGATIEVQLRRPFTGTEREGLAAAVGRYAAYLDVPTTLAEPTMLG
jgi:Winged helix DNA-binding domain